MAAPLRSLGCMLLRKQQLAVSHVSGARISPNSPPTSAQVTLISGFRVLTQGAPISPHVTPMTISASAIFTKATLNKIAYPLSKVPEKTAFRYMMTTESSLRNRLPPNSKITRPIFKQGTKACNPLIRNVATTGSVQSKTISPTTEVNWSLKELMSKGQERVQKRAESLLIDSCILSVTSMSLVWTATNVIPVLSAILSAILLAFGIHLGAKGDKQKVEETPQLEENKNALKVIAELLERKDKRIKDLEEDLEIEQKVTKSYKETIERLLHDQISKIEAATKANSKASSQKEQD